MTTMPQPTAFRPTGWLARMRRDWRLPSAAFRVAHAVASEARHGVCEAPFSRIAALGGVTVTTVHDAIDKLAARGYIEISHKSPDGSAVITLKKAPRISPN